MQKKSPNLVLQEKRLQDLYLSLGHPYEMADLSIMLLRTQKNMRKMHKMLEQRQERNSIAAFKMLDEVLG